MDNKEIDKEHILNIGIKYDLTDELFCIQLVQDINYIKMFTKSSLMNLIEQNKLEDIEILLNNNINEIDLNGQTALIYASKFNRLEILKLLINKDRKSVV